VSTGRNPLSRAGPLFRFAASLKVAIPLLVVTIAVTIVGSLQADTEYYRTWWYLGLLGLNGVSLLFITILHIPSILARKGRNALIGVVLTHLGILMLIAGAIYGGMSGFRYPVKAVEGEMTVVPGLPFVIRLDELIVEEYPDETFSHMDLELLPRKRQDSHITLFRGGERWREVIAAPGNPARFDGITILPSISDIGWYFELIVDSPGGLVKTIPVKPWAPPVINVGRKSVMVHSLMDRGEKFAQVMQREDDQVTVLGIVGEESVVELDGYTISMGDIRRYTGLVVYNRPHAPMLVAGSVILLFGLLWHFYFRHRDRRRADWSGERDD